VKLPYRIAGQIHGFWVPGSAAGVEVLEQDAGEMATPV